MAISFKNLFASDDDGSYSSRAAELARQQKLAEMLTQMSQQEIPVSSAGGISAPVSPYSALAKALTSFGGSYLSGRAAEDEASLKKQDRAMAQEALKNFYNQPDTKQLALAKGLASPVETEMAFNTPSYNVASANLKMPSLNGTTDMTLPITMPKMPGEYNQQTTANISLPGISRAEIETVRGRETTPEEQMQKIAPLLEGGEASRSLYNALMPDIMKRMTPDKGSMFEGSKYGNYRLNPDGTITQIVAPSKEEKENSTSPFAKLISEREALVSSGIPLNDPRIIAYDKKIELETTRTPGVSISMGDKSYNTTMANLDSTTLTGLQSKATNAKTTLDSLNQLQKLSNANIYSGNFADVKAKYGPLFEWLGVDPTKVSNSQQYQASVGNLALSKIKQLGTNPTDSDLKFILQTIPTLSMQSAARAELINYLKKVASQDINNYKAAYGYYLKNKTMAGFDDQPVSGRGGWD